MVNDIDITWKPAPANLKRNRENVVIDMSCK